MRTRRPSACTPCTDGQPRPEPRCTAPLCCACDRPMRQRLGSSARGTPSPHRGAHAGTRRHRRAPSQLMSHAAADAHPPPPPRPRAGAPRGPQGTARGRGPARNARDAALRRARPARRARSGAAALPRPTSTPRLRPRARCVAAAAAARLAAAAGPAPQPEPQNTVRARPPRPRWMARGFTAQPGSWWGVPGQKSPIPGGLSLFAPRVMVIIGVRAGRRAGWRRRA